jgi:CheY-like chemotaxis protein
VIKLANQNHIIMVDDNAGDRFFVEHCLSLSSIKNPHLTFRNGHDFLAYLEKVKAREQPMPALVLLDLNMPGLNGLEVLSATRSDPYFDKVPIFCVLTSSCDPRDRESAASLGASGFYTKASTLEEYVSFFDSLVPAADSSERA